MTCSSCGSPNAAENCAGCEAWICEDCAQDYDGYYLCQLCYGAKTGESYDEPGDDDDLDYDGEESGGNGDGDGDKKDDGVVRVVDDENGDEDKDEDRY